MHGTPSAWRQWLDAVAFSATFPGMFSIPIWAIYLFGGRYWTDPDGVRMDWLVLSIAYPVGALLIGAIAGLGTPLRRNVLSSCIIGTIAIAPLAAGIALSMGNALTHWAVANTIVAGSLSLAFGITLGICLAPSKKLAGRDAPGVERK